MYTLKSIVRRGAALGAAVAVFAAAVVPSVPVFADALNPLTERSLLLSSSAPGWQDTDGSGNSYAVPNSVGENYAPAGSGPNGKKSGETFTFKTSTTPSSAVKGFSLQYCTEAAGWCQAPGNNPGDADPNDDGSTADSTRALNTDPTGHAAGKSDFDFVGAFTEGSGAGQFQVVVGGAPQTGWSFTKARLENSQHTGTLTGKNNYITLTNSTAATIPAGTEVQIVFKPSETVYITNPGSDAFFVKINTYSSDTSLIGNHNDATPNDNTDTPSHTVIDGGVTVANVMTDSIHITTKVLETMAFSVGTQNPDTVNSPSHGICDAINVVNNNRLNLGNVNAEYSLETDTAYDVNSYWRLSSNSSGGATVYYSGNTLANTVGDEIKAIGTTVGTPNGGKDHSHPGTEQFGLALVDAGLDTMGTGTFDPEHITPNIAPLAIEADYADGASGTNAVDGINEANWTDNSQFAFDKTSNTTPAVIAQDSDDVISCATSKVRYVANIAADTPAGVYTTKINYLAAPQY